jgi:hypothetical protein
MKEDSEPLTTGIVIRPLLAAACVLFALVPLFYAEEDFRGWLVWKNCQAALEAKGNELDWNAYIPPVVADAANFFKAPDMADWFVRQEGNSTNKLTTLLKCAHNQTPAPFVEFTILSAADTRTAPKRGGTDMVLRYSSYGSALFDYTNAGAEANIPIIMMDGVPITCAIDNLARQFRLEYSIDPTLEYGQRGQGGQFKPEPILSVRWRNITAREALLTLLNQYDLQMVEDAGSGRARITKKDPATPRIYAAETTRRKLHSVLRKTFQTNFGENNIAAMGFILLTNSVSQIKPTRLVLISEITPADSEIIAIVRQFLPDEASRGSWLGMHVERSGTNSLRVVLDAQTPADYLAWSDQFQPEFNQIREALKRPAARMDGDYARPLDMPVQNFVTVRVLSQTLAQRAKCDLLLGQPEKALPELTLLHDLCHLLEAPPGGKPMPLVTAMINAAVTGLYVNTIAEGLQSHSWKEPQLAGLQKQLSEINLPPWLMLALKEECAATCRLLGTMSASKVATLNRDMVNWNAITPEKLPDRIRRWVTDRLWARGWSYQNMAHIATLYHNFQQGINPAQGTISPVKCQTAADAVSQFRRQSPSPYNCLAVGLIPNFSTAARFTARDQTSANEAEIACALERYHLSHGDYPETLKALVPDFMEKVPSDVIGGAPLHYQHQANGKVLLYSLGWSERDDHGSPGKGRDDSDGDWIWKS